VVRRFQATECFSDVNGHNGGRALLVDFDDVIVSPFRQQYQLCGKESGRCVVGNLKSLFRCSIVSVMKKIGSPLLTYRGCCCSCRMRMTTSYSRALTAVQWETGLTEREQQQLETSTKTTKGIVEQQRWAR